MPLMLPPGVHMGVHDDVSIGDDCTVTIVRKYSFTNTTQDTISFAWNGQDYVPASACDVAVEEPGIKLGVSAGAAPVLEWDLPSTTLDPEGTLSVSVSFNCQKLVQLNPLRLSLRYQSTWLCEYSFAVHSPFGGLVHPNDCTLHVTSASANPALILGHDGVLRTEHSLRVSGLAGASVLAIEKPLDRPAAIPLLQYYAGRSVSDAKPLSGHVMIVIPHLLRDAVPYIESLCAAGLDPEHAFVIGIPYSTKQEVGQALWQRGFKHIELPEDYPFIDTVRKVLEKALTVCRETKQPLVIIEDGGVCRPVTSQGICVGFDRLPRNR